jgi:hypothetical protein
VSPAPRPDPARRPYLGYRAGDADTPFGHFYRPTMAPLPAQVVEANSLGAQAPELLGDIETAPELLDDGYQRVENGLTVAADGSIRVAVLTRMPGVAAEMWDWWFGWHGCDARRYKLWHPRAHLYAEWDDGADRGRRGRDRYVGRTSFVDEYIGATLAKAAIRFVPPSELRIDEAELAPGKKRTMVCARIGSSQFPVDIGWLVHDVRATEDGSEMRSRFWLGGRHFRPRSGAAAIGGLASRLGGLVFRQGTPAAQALLVHCSQEMSHLASFLADLHGELSGSETDQDA